MKASKIKNWCDETITPMAWQRVVVKNLDVFKSKGWGLAELSNPDDTIVLDASIVETVKATIKELYQMEVPESVLVS